MQTGSKIILTSMEVSAPPQKVFQVKKLFGKLKKLINFTNKIGTMTRQMLTFITVHMYTLYDS